VLRSAQAMDVPTIARIAFTSEDRVREVIRNVNADGPMIASAMPPGRVLDPRLSAVLVVYRR
jgi:hypothetical protein